MAAATIPAPTQEVAVSTFSISCPCQCGQIVEARDAGFTATTVEIDTCQKWQSVSGGILAPLAVEIRKSLAYSLTKPAATLTHCDGLVAF